MSKFISNWIQENGIQTKESKDFSSGFLFGKLLQNLGIEDDFKSYIDSDKTDALLANYTLIEKTLRKLNIKFTSTMAIDLINGNQQSFLKVVYEIKKSLDQVPVQKVFTAVKPKFESYPSSPVDGQSVNLKVVDQEPLPFDKQSIKHFETMLKSKLKRNNQFVSKFRVPEPLVRKKELPPIPKLEMSKNETAPAAEVVKKVNWEPEVVKDIPVVKKIPKINQTERVLAQIDSFESKIDTQTNSEDPEDIHDFIVNRATMDPTQHLKQLHKVMDQPTLLDQKDSLQYLEKIRLHRLESEASRKDREKQRKKVLLMHQKVQKEMEKKVLNDLMEQKLLRQSKQERRIAEQLMQVRHEKDVMHENRLYREEQYAKQRQKEYEDALERERQLCLTTQQEYREQVGIQMEQHVAILEQKKALKHEKNVEFCNHLVNQLVSLTFQVLDYKKLNDGKPVPPKKLREYKLLFQHDVTIKEPEFKIEKDFIPASSDDPVLEEQTREQVPLEIKVLDSQELEDYIQYQGQWHSDQIQLKKNDGLSQLVEELFQITLPPIEPYPFTPIPAVPLRIALTGKKYAGKQTLAKYLCEKYQMQMIRLDDLVKDAIAHADIAVKKKTPGDKEKKLSKQQIGAKLQLAMMEGQAPDDSLLVALVLEAMAVEPEVPGGYLLVDFPKTKVQAQLLEREISGYEDPKPIKKGDLKRPKEKERATTGNHRNRSLINPVDNPQDNPVLLPVSGLDAVFLLDVSNEVAFKRASGQLYDPITKEKYHVENNPPPTNAPGTYDRLAVVEDQARAMSQLQYHLTAFQEEEEGLKEWLGQFKTLYVIDANSSKESTGKKVTERLNEIVKQINKNHQKESEVSIDLKEQIEVVEAEPLHSERSIRPSVIMGKNGEVIEGLNPETEKKLRKPSTEFAKIMIDQWKTIESTYTEQLKFAFRAHRRTSHDILVYFYDIKHKFMEFLKRPDLEQTLIDTFLSEYNAIEEDFRADPDVKAELHQRAEELREKLWEIADRRRDEAEAERISIIEDKWTEDQSFIVANIIVTILQAEADRFFTTRQLILDYYKDSEGVACVDIPKNQLRIPFIQNTPQAPIEIAQPLITLSEQYTLQRKDQVQSATQQKVPATKEKKEKKEKKQAQEKVATPTPAPEKDVTQFLDPETNFFPDVQGAIDCFLNALQSPEYSLETILAPERAKEQSLIVQLIETEETLIKQRIEQIKQISMDWFKSLKNNSVQVYFDLDDAIGSRYKTEIEIARDVMNVIKETIESEQKLGNLLLLSGDRLTLDYGTLIVPHKDDPVPEPPTEKPSFDQFTVLQLSKMCNQLKLLYPSGFIPTKQMIEYLVKTSTLYASYEPLPESYIQADLSQIQQLIHHLDPFETGFLSWRKFMILNARLIPVEMEAIVDAKAQFMRISGYPFLTLVEFKEVHLWFEPPVGTTRRGFDRPTKLKETLFDLFSTQKDDQIFFNAQEFLITCCIDDLPVMSLEKAFFVLQQNDTCSISEVHSIFQQFMCIVPPTHRTDPTSRESVNPYPFNKLEKAWIGLEERANWEQVSHAINAECPDWLACPLYQLEDVSLGSGSRPSSGKQPSL